MWLSEVEVDSKATVKLGMVEDYWRLELQKANLQYVIGQLNQGRNRRKGRAAGEGVGRGALSTRREEAAQTLDTIAGLANASGIIH